MHCMIQTLMAPSDQRIVRQELHRIQDMIYIAFLRITRIHKRSKHVRLVAISNVNLTV